MKINKLKEQLLAKNRTITQLETEISSLKDQMHDSEYEKWEISREKDILSLKLETISKIWEKNKINIQEEFKKLNEEKQKDRQEGEGEDDFEDELDFADIGTLSIVNEYRFKNEKLSKDLQDKDTKIKLIQKECESLLKISMNFI